MLDVIKAFDKVRYCKLFNELLDHYISPVVLRILIYMYMNHTLRVQWCHTLTSCFLKYVMVSSNVEFRLLSYLQYMLGRMEQSDVGCHIGGHFFL